MCSVIDFHNEIKTLYGKVKRCRGFYIYTEKARVLDMYLDGGMSILGRKSGQHGLTLKQFTDKGLNCFLPTHADDTLKKALNLLFPDHTEIRFFSSYKDEDKILNLHCEKSYILNLWKPFLSENNLLKNNDGFFVLPPFYSNIKIAVFKMELKDKPAASTYMPSALEKAALARAFFDLIRAIESEKNQNELKNYKGKKAKKQDIIDLAAYEEAQKACSKVWEQKGSYLFPKFKQEDYPIFFKRALEAGYLISPNFNIPSILPKIKIYTKLINFLKDF